MSAKNVVTQKNISNLSGGLASEYYDVNDYIDERYENDRI